ncbi:MAG TPA: protein-L-isoaspartate(D-aspartate) O-methyltransferase [Candidatus Saccharimonadales bacterium]|jgi:protein-L-isoaspartate(D-aspartate) O-methyltransferase|nr:protein-L-isoaspartate(D-aspartate) O-methyltransferase [Candidatus Saccharimonadales bacterium]
MSSAGQLPMAAERRAMVEEQLRRRGIQDERVLAAMTEIPRHEFVDPQWIAQAYSDHPIAIGEQQTTSQPYMIAIMLQVAEIKPTDRVLEIGAGSGYQTAVLSRLAAQVFAMERHPELTETARLLLQRLGHENVTLVTGDGSLGLPQAAPFDAIIVAAAAPRVPPALMAQMAVGGRLAIPVGNSEDQVLHLVRKQPHGISVECLEGCRFVPLIGEQGFREGK